MRLILRLIFSELTRRKTRVALVLFGMAASSALVVWVLGGYNGLMEQFHDDAEKQLGRYQFRLAADSGSGPGMMRGGGAGGGALGGSPF